MLRTNGYVWDSLIYLAAPGAPLQIHSVSFAYDFKSEERGRHRYKQLLQKLSLDCITWTYVGVFETRKEWSTMMNGAPRGFGHLNGAPGQLITKEVTSVEAVPGCHSPPPR